MKPNDVDQPMGNAELRLTLAGIESEISEVKDIAIETRDQAKKTNGRVDKLENWRWFLGGGLALLSFMIIITATILAGLISLHKI